MTQEFDLQKNRLEAKASSLFLINSKKGVSDQRAGLISGYPPKKYQLSERGINFGLAVKKCC